MCEFWIKLFNFSIMKYTKYNILSATTIRRFIYIYFVARRQFNSKINNNNQKVS